MLDNYNFVQKSILELFLCYWNLNFQDNICQPGWFSPPTYGCYHIFDERVSWVEARDRCAQQDGYLASWETRDEFDMVKTFLEENFCKIRVNLNILDSCEKKTHKDMCLHFHSFLDHAGNYFSPSRQKARISSKVNTMILMIWRCKEIGIHIYAYIYIYIHFKYCPYRNFLYRK